MPKESRKRNDIPTSKDIQKVGTLGFMCGLALLVGGLKTVVVNVCGRWTNSCTPGRKRTTPCGGCSKVLSFFSRPFAGPSRSFRKLSRVGFYHCRRKWFFVGARGFQGFMQLPWHVLCPLITDTLIAEEQEASQPSSFHVGVFLVGHNPP